MNNVNRIFVTVLICVCSSFCHAENAKLTAELMNSGFHRLVNFLFSLVYFAHFQCYKLEICITHWQRRGIYRCVSGLSGQTAHIPYQAIVTSQRLC